LWGEEQQQEEEEEQQDYHIKPQLWAGVGFV
jgi:hypothetical protein